MYVKGFKSDFGKLPYKWDEIKMFSLNLAKNTIMERMGFRM